MDFFLDAKRVGVFVVVAAHLPAESLGLKFQKKRSKHNDTGWAKTQAARKENQFIMGKAWMRCAGNEIIRDDATFRQCHLPKVSVLKSPSLQNRAEVK